MSRPLRIEYPGAYYHVMNRGRGRQQIFRHREDYQRFLKLLGETHRMWGVRVHAYCLLPNHYHLLLETPQGNLSRALRHIDGLYTQQYNRVHSTDGPLFRGRYKAILIEADHYLLQLIRYIHLNPVEANLVREPGSYLWSSHRHYLGKEEKPDGLVTDEVLGRFNSRSARAVERYQAFIGDGLDKDTQQLYSRGNFPAMWGSQGFREKIRKQLAKGRMDYEIPERKRQQRRASLKTIEDVVIKSYGISRQELLRKRRGHWNEPRNLAIYLGRMVGGCRLKEIGNRWGQLQYSSVSRMVDSVRRLMEKDRSFRQRVEGIERRILKSRMYGLLPK